MIENKKGMNPLYSLIIAIIIGLAIFGFSSAGPFYNIKYIGASSLELIDMSYKSEAFVLYTKQSAKIATDDSLYELLYDKETLNNPDCGFYGDYYVWATKSNECYPNINDVFLNVFKLKFESLIENYPKDLKIKQEKNNYVFLVNKEELVANGLRNLEAISDDKKMFYSINPTFTIKLPYNFEINQQVVEMAKDIFTSCMDSDNPENCVKGLSNTYYTDFKDGFAMFDVDTGYKFYKDGKGDQLIIKFCLSFS